MDQAQSLREKVNKQRPLKIITVASGKGGVGKSVLTVNLAIALSRMGLKVLILDADFGLANVDVMFGAAAKYNLSHFLRGEKTIAEIIQTGHEDVRFISGGSGLYELLTIGEDEVGRLLGSLTETDIRMDYILCDIGAGINENIVRIILASTETIIVTTPEPPSVVDAYAMIKTIVRQEPRHKIHIVINKCVNTAEAETVLKGFTEIVYKNLGKRVQPLGVAMYDEEVTKSIKSQMPIIMSDPNGPTGKAIRSIANKLLEIPADKQPVGVLSALFSRVFKK